MKNLIILLFVIPFMGFLKSLFYSNHRENLISLTTRATAAVQVILSLTAFLTWVLYNRADYSVPLLEVYKTMEFNFGLDLFYDLYTGLYLLIGAMIFLVISKFSRSYMHRESGYKRFHNHLLLFFAGYNLLLLSGNFETLFLGWEIVGITSFLMIAFYRERYLPVRNAMKVLSFYRIGDVALLGAIWFSHHLFHVQSDFSLLNVPDALNQAMHAHPVQSFIIALLFILAAAVKSAQFPFSSWLPRAMEGPTTSTAAFYGSLSLHLGIFLLLRTSVIWMHVPLVRYLIVLIGITTALIGHWIGSVQSSAKTQIAYASISQIGIIFVELGFGFHILALLHVAANAFLRTYQLLSSPSTMGYLLRQQIFGNNTNTRQFLFFLPERYKSTFYILSLKEWNLDYLWYRFVWRPFKKLGKSLHFLRNPLAEGFFVILVFLAVVIYIIHPIQSIQRLEFISWIYAIVALILVLIAWTERRSAMRAWIYITLCQIFFMLSVIEQHTFDLIQIAIYLSGTLGAFIGGSWSLSQVRMRENNIDLNGFHGHIYEHPRYALLFLVSALTMSGFPISPTFLGFDIMFSDIEMNHRILLLMSCLTFVLIEIAVLRIYARVFLGQHVKTYHEVAFRST